MPPPKSIHDEDLHAYIDSRPPPARLVSAREELDLRIRQRKPLDTDTGSFILEKVHDEMRAMIERAAEEKIRQARSEAFEAQRELARLKEQAAQEAKRKIEKLEDRSQAQADKSVDKKDEFGKQVVLVVLTAVLAVLGTLLFKG